MGRKERGVRGILEGHPGEVRVLWKSGEREHPEENTACGKAMKVDSAGCVQGTAEAVWLEWNE